MRELGAVKAEQRFGAAVDRLDVAFGVEHQDALGRGVEDGGEFFGVGVAGRRRLATAGSASTMAEAIASLSAAPPEQIKRERGIVVPRNRIEPRVGRGRRFVRRRLFRCRVACGNRHRGAGFRRAAGGRNAGLDIERVEAAGFFQRVQAVIADALEESRVGKQQPVETIDQDADGNEIQQRLVAPGDAARRRLGRRQPFRRVADRRGCATGAAGSRQRLR